MRALCGYVQEYVWLPVYFSRCYRMADTNTLPLEGGGMYFVIVGIRTTGISIAGKDER